MPVVFDPMAVVGNVRCYVSTISSIDFVEHSISDSDQKGMFWLYNDFSIGFLYNGSIFGVFGTPGEYDIGPKKVVELWQDVPVQTLFIVDNIKGYVDLLLDRLERLGASNEFELRRPIGYDVALG